MPDDEKLVRVAEAICNHRGLVCEGEVGAGAFKHTFAVRLADTSRRALKLYRRAGVDPRTQREVDAISRCAHPGVARFELIERWCDGPEEYVFSLEEYLSGGTLTQRIARSPLQPAELKSLATKLVDAVAHIASLDLVHRDLKPDNVMFREPGGDPVIVDFGLVRDLAQTSLTRTWLPNGPGTPYFSPPEQLNNEKSLIDWRADQFSLGVLLTVSCLGAHPYATSGLKPHEIVDRVARREQPASEFVDWATRTGFVQLVQMVEPWPVRRFRTPKQLVAAWGSGTR